MFVILLYMLVVLIFFFVFFFSIKEDEYENILLISKAFLHLSSPVNIEGFFVHVEHLKYVTLVIFVSQKKM